MPFSSGIAVHAKGDEINRFGEEVRTLEQKRWENWLKLKNWIFLTKGENKDFWKCRESDDKMDCRG